MIPTQVNKTKETITTGLPAELQVIASRHCSREYVADKVPPKKLVAQVIQAATASPSSQNNQPWSLTVLQGKHRDELSAALLAVFDANNDAENKKPGYKNRPKPDVMPERLLGQVNSYGASFYDGIYGLERSDAKARRAIYRNNYLFWGAPLQILLHVPGVATEGTFVDAGCFLQSLLLGFHAVGLGATPQFSVAAYAPTVKKVVGLDDNVTIVCGISVGYPKSETIPKSYYPSRLGVEDVVEWKGYEDEE